MQNKNTNIVEIKNAVVANSGSVSLNLPINILGILGVIIILSVLGIILVG